MSSLIPSNPQKSSDPQRSGGFTLLELIIVIAILAILSVAVVLVINPAETLARARDSQRLSDLAAIKTSIGLYLVEVSGPDLSGGDDTRCVGRSTRAASTSARIFYSIAESDINLTFDTDLMGDVGADAPGGADWLDMCGISVHTFRVRPQRLKKRQHSSRTETVRLFSWMWETMLEVGLEVTRPYF